METVMTLPTGATPKKKIKTGAVLGIIAGAFALAGGFFVFVYKDRDGNTLWKKLTSKTDGGKLEDIAEPTEAPPTGITKWTAESFPLKRGMFGGQIKLLQQKIGAGNDGKFGAGTEAKVIAKFGSPTVSRAQYDSVINPAATGGGTNFNSVKKALMGVSKNISGGIRYPAMGKNDSYLVDFYTNGRVVFNNKSGKVIAKGAYYKGGKTIKLDDGYSADNLSDVRFATYAVIKHIES